MKQDMIAVLDLGGQDNVQVARALREKGVQIDYKAVVTPHNRQWTVLELLEELKRERQAIREAQQS